MVNRCRGLRLLLWLLLFLAVGVEARQIVDHAGRTVTVPDHISRLYGSAPPLMVLIHTVAPDELIGISFPFEEEGKRYVSPTVASLPVLGGVFGMGPTVNPETIMVLKPDVVLAWKSPFVDQAKVEEAFAKTGIPVVFVKLDTLSDWPAALEFLGRLSGREKRGTELANYVRSKLAYVSAAVAKVPEKKRVRVYYAEGPNGLATDCDKSFHAEVIELAGGYNVYRCEPKSHMGMEPISLEQVMAFDPEVILAQDRNFAATVGKDPRWQGVRAVRNGRVYAIPHWPFNWMDRPPSTMRALGMQWVASLLYPKEVKLDMAKETKAFYRLFLEVDLSPRDLDLLLKPPLEAAEGSPVGHAH